MRSVLFRRRPLLALLALAVLAAGLALLSFQRFEAAVAARMTPFPPPETAVTVSDRNGDLLRAFANPDGRWRLDARVAEVDPRFLAMLLAWEDRRFRSHSGVDAKAFLRAAWQAVRHRRVVSGGSTLSMQVARVLHRLPNGSLAAKREQILSALALEGMFSKDKILELYLKLAPYGGNIEGIRVASLAWFGKEPRRLTAAEAALLVALPQSPERYRPDRHPERATRARDRVLSRMAELDILSEAEAARARAEPVPTRRRELPLLAAHASEELRRETPGRRKFRLTVDRTIQERLEAYARDRVQGLEAPLSLALLVADHRSGEILGLVGSPGYFDAERQGFVDLTAAVRSPGSTLKPLIYGLAFERGIAHPESLVDDRPATFAGYTPQNFDHDFQGVITARRALQLSRNLPAVEMLAAVGPARLVQRLGRAGAAPEFGDRTLPSLAIGLGGVGLSLRDLVAVYAALASGGSPRPLRLDADAPPQGAARADVLNPQAAWYVTSILAGAATTAKGSPGEIAHKTGTSYGYRDAWSIGYDGRHVVGVWLGRPDGAPVPGLTGESAAVPVMRDVFARLGPTVRLPGPPPGILGSAGGALPPPLRRFGRAFGGTAAGAGLAPEIAYPPHAARVELLAGMQPELALKVRNGSPPFTWYVDGLPVVQEAASREAVWRPREAGFVEISVVDASGASARSRVFVE